MTHMLEGQLRSAVEEADKERALKEVSEATLRDQTVALSTDERKATKARKARAAVDKRVAELERKLVNIWVKLAYAEGINSKLKRMWPH